ncbi:hypothetical protein KZ843_09225 [Pseudomonas aeruginosa]|nr:hypothetical protein [Pseudomonas aeruginosa]MBW6123064.1 hypothetical protein [Pseudomonas aeruginosa]
MLKTTSDLSLLFHVLRAAISHEMPALNPAEVSAVVERWERPDGVVSAERIGTAILLAADCFLDSIGELVGSDKAGTDSWLNNCAPLICGALHDIFEHCLAQSSRNQRGLPFDFLAEMSTFSKVLQHVTETGEDIGQARVRTARMTHGLRRVA